MGLLNDRRREMGGNLHYDAEVEYLENNIKTNGPYILTNYYITDPHTEVYLSFMILDESGSQILTNQHSTQTDKYMFRICLRGAHIIDFAYNNYPQNIPVNSRITLNPGVKYDFHIYNINEITYMENMLTQEVKYDDKLMDVYNNPYPLKLFSGYIDNAYFNGRIYELKILYKGETVLDFQPVRVGDDGYMYDRVSGKLFGNSGDGRFILGPDIN